MRIFKAMVDWRMGLAFALAMDWRIGGFSATAQAAGLSFNLQAGTIDYGLANAAPGTPIEFDYRAVSNGSVTVGQAPLYTQSFTLGYEFGQPPTAVKLQLSSGEILSLPLVNESQGIFTWYTAAPTYPDPNPPPRGPMPPSLRAELKDGVLSARLWSEGPSNGPSDFYHVFSLGFGHRLDMTDLGYLASHYGTTSGALFSDGDLDGDGDVDLTDLGMLASYYAAGQAQASADLSALGYDDLSRAVPEPGSLSMVVCAALAIGRARRR